MANDPPRPLDQQRFQRVYRLMLTAREIDFQESSLVLQNLAHFHVSGTGHEAMAILADHLEEFDWLHLHYRDKALLLARGVPIIEFFRSLLCRGNSHSAGRQMSAHLSSPRLRILSMVGPVGNNSLQAVGVAAAIKEESRHPIVICSVGDGTTQEGEFYEAVAEAVRCQLPVLFLVENNHYSISTSTLGRTFFSLGENSVEEFFGLPLHYVDGTKVESLDQCFKGIVPQVRRTRSPAIVIMNLERLCNHTNADDQSKYRPSWEQPESLREADPILNLERTLPGFDTKQAILQEIQEKVSSAAEEAVGDVSPILATYAKAPFPEEYLAKNEYLGSPQLLCLTMRESLNHTLRHHLRTNSRVFLYGEDIEDPKGDVFGITQGLSTEFPNRVQNSPLSESTIIGTCIGRALTGQRPVAFIQFADFLPIAFNQICSELASMYWRSNGDWQCPVIVMATCGAYKPGLGPFHAQTFDSLAAHLPGLDVVMPSSAADAAGLLNAAFASNRPTLFLYPKSCLNLTERSTSEDVAEQFVPLGKARHWKSGSDLTLVSWGNPLTQCLRAVETLGSAGLTVDLFDLRSLSPWDEQAILNSSEKTGRLVVVHEDNITGGFGAEIIARVTEQATQPVRCRRIGRPDTFIPCNFPNQLELLPSFKRILETCASLLEYQITWEQPSPSSAGLIDIVATGSGPSDESVIVIKLHVKLGDIITAGQVIAEVDAEKCVIDQASSVSGTVVELCVSEGGDVPVGQPLIRIRSKDQRYAVPPPIYENPGKPHLTKIDSSIKPSVARQTRTTEIKRSRIVYASRPSCVFGSKVVSSAALAKHIPEWSNEEVIKRTGIESRYWASEGENVVSMAELACQKLLKNMGKDIPSITTIFCSTSTPSELSPSVACQIANNAHLFPHLSDRYSALDINAACSGFLYGLRLASDLLFADPLSGVLLVTSEVISPMLNPNDPATIFLFADASTATFIKSDPFNSRCLAIEPPICLSAPDPERAIHIPCKETSNHLTMNGITVARTAPKSMASSVRQVLKQANISVSDISALIPHPGSKRVLGNVAAGLEIPSSKVMSTMKNTGNTSSSSIPLALNSFWEELPSDKPIVLAAFGAGFTSAAAVAYLKEKPNER